MPAIYLNDIIFPLLAFSHLSDMTSLKLFTFVQDMLRLSVSSDVVAITPDH